MAVFQLENEMTRVMAFVHGTGPRRRQEPPTFAELVANVQLISGYNIDDGRPSWISSFGNAARQAAHYRRGRVFLAGDAAHVHSPAGGQGLNTGLQDAANLSWKLAAVARGWADDSLLDSYHAERYPVGRMVLRMSGGLMRMMLLEPGMLRRSLVLASAAALRVRPVADKAARAISGISIGYAAGSGAHPLAGRRMPDVPLAAGHGRLYELLRGGRFVLLAAGDASTAAAAWADRIEVAARRREHPQLILVRPDGYTAWASDEAGPVRRDASLREALTRWCGAPADLAVAQRRPG
jgi:hypothetical protein